MTKIIDPSVVQLITEASSILNTIQLTVMEANGSSVKAVKDLTTKLLPMTAGLTKAISQLGVRTGKMEGELQILKERPTSGEKKIDRENYILNAVNEMEERRDRAKNIIIMNVPESISKNQEQKLKHDNNEVTNIISAFDGINTEKINVLRLGKEVAGRTRPIKVSLGSANEAKLIIQNNRLLKDGLRIKADLTFAQREQMRSLWSEVEERRTEGEDNLTVKFFNGVPKITKKPKKFAAESIQERTTRTSGD
jgi:hypothetical protein